MGFKWIKVAGYRLQVEYLNSIVMTDSGKTKSYRDLEIYAISFKLAIEIHHMTLKLPKYELYELGNQIRRSSKSIVANIVEGYGRKRYKSEFIRFLIFAHSSCDETISHLTMIHEIHFKDDDIIELINQYDQLGKKIHSFISYVENNWK
jgi:four helix bundle protein